MSKRRFSHNDHSYHITHRCHNRGYFLKFRQDRDNYIRRLWEARRRYSVDLHNFIVTCDHVHLLLSAEDGSAIPEFIEPGLFSF